MLQLFGRRHDDDEVEIVLARLPEKSLGSCEHLGKRRWRILIDEAEAFKSPLMACLVLVHEWGHYRAHHDPQHFDHLGAWPEEAARAYRLAFTRTA